MNRKFIGFALCICLGWSSAVLAEHEAVDTLDLESLMDSDIQLTSVMRRLQSARETAASTYILSGKEILSSGVTSIPQALTLVPGLQVRKIDNNLWAITSRSSASRYASKLLVLVDGQSIYDPIQAGVKWENINLPLMDVDKIEVIRGQGSLLWGSNATNGVINIITKHSEDTRQLTVQATKGNELNYDLTARYGSDIGGLGSFNLHAMSKDVQASDRSHQDLVANDTGRVDSVGGRLDLNINDHLFTLFKAHYQHMTYGSNVALPNLTTNKNEFAKAEDDKDAYSFMSRTDHIISETASQMVQIAYTYDKHDSRHYKENKKTFDFDYQMNAIYGDVQFDWGANYRYIDLEVENTDYLSLLSDLDAMEQFGAFAQFQMDLVPDSLKLVIGNKSEHNDFTGWEHQPSAKLIWLVDSKNTLWGSLSRGVRIPSVIEYNASFKAGGLSVASLLSSVNPTLANALPSDIADFRIERLVAGNENIEAEKSISKELGYRYSENRWNVDLSLFHTETNNVVAVESSLSPYSVEQLIQAYLTDITSLPGYLSSSTLTTMFVSGGKLTTYGGELVIGRQITPRIKGEFGYSYTDQKYDLPSKVNTAIGFSTVLEQYLLKMSASVNESHTLFSMLRYEKSAAYRTEDYYALDLSWRWQVSPLVVFGLTGNNLVHGEMLEFKNVNEFYVQPTYVEPSVMANVLVNF
ncbi:TonB-dependent receptor [Vibrio tapetis subsp. quintayensis]|uniref:TonB-dependent receptor plug domain-containing protein n=1 Tax=Vibrio tapetis TaxID=52443 RepID=UPI0025B43E2C|nr:TonB-dependent receptor [Vibrio tapetis]MDN3682814.1 TonB-dependent receptor [Vibrio tapetis subsp. quintayensis]